MVKYPKIIGNTWFNSKPLAPEDLAGKVVLVDFWTYSCVNCFRTIPHLRDWWEKYKDKNFIMVGIHTPEFEFEKDPENVGQAIRDLKIGWPVVLDNDQINWKNFANHYWPAKYLIDPEGNIVYEHFGEGNYGETERMIQKLLELKDVSFSLDEKEENLPGKFCFRPTPELYCGYSRGRITNAGGYHYGAEFDYQAPKVLEDDSIALAGKLLAEEEYVESREAGSSLWLFFHAVEVNLVLSPADGAAIVDITLDGKPLSDDIRGKDVSRNGKIEIKKSRMYNIMKSAGGGLEGRLQISAEKGNFRAYAFTFSGCL